MMLTNGEIREILARLDDDSYIAASIVLEAIATDQYSARTLELTDNPLAIIGSPEHSRRKAKWASHLSKRRRIKLLEVSP